MVQIQIALYDLLPPGKLSTAFYIFGVGIYHSAIRIPELQVEFAFGGILPQSPVSLNSNDTKSSHSNTRSTDSSDGIADDGTESGKIDTRTGIFALPSPEDHRVVERLMPGLRFLRRIDAGEAFNVDWVKLQGEERRSQRNSHHKPLPPLPFGTGHHSRQRPRRAQYNRGMSSSSSTGHIPLLQQDRQAMGPNQDGGRTPKSSAYSVDEWGRTLSDLVSTTSVSDSMSHETLIVQPIVTQEPSNIHDTDDADPRASRSIGKSNIAKQKAGTSMASDWLSTDRTDDTHTSPTFSYSRYSSYDEEEGVDGDLTVREHESIKHSPDKQAFPGELSMILDLIDKMKSEPAWRATRYHLLSKNCNNFTDELCYRLTGRRAPNWINRAAWLGQSLPCLVPEGWLDPPTVDNLEDRQTSTSSTRLTEAAVPSSQRPTSPLIAVPYIETGSMHVEVAYSQVRSGQSANMRT